MSCEVNCDVTPWTGGAKVQSLNLSAEYLIVFLHARPTYLLWRLFSAHVIAKATLIELIH